MDRPRILVIDDDPVALGGVAQKLEPEGLEVARAPSTGRAMGLLRSNRYNLIIVALATGWPGNAALLKAAREGCADTPIIIASAVGHIAAVIDQLKPGVDDYLIEPYGTEELLFRVRACLRRAKLARSRDELATKTEDYASEARQLHEVLAEEIRRHERAKESLAGSLHEKELLAREIGHRIKNNLAMIAALVNLESMHPTGRSYAASLAQLLKRVRAIYLVYDKLSIGRGLVLDCYRDYVEALVREIFQSAGRSSEEILVKVEVADIGLDLDRAIPLGLIIQELVSNSLIHGFPDHATGVIRVRLERGEEEYCLTVSDTGIGFPDGFDPENGQSLGFLLVRTLAGQLDGRVETPRCAGAAVAVRFPLSELRR